MILLAEATLCLVLPPAPGTGTSQIDLLLCWGRHTGWAAWTLCPDGSPVALLVPVFGGPEDLVEHVVHLTGHLGADPLETIGRWEHAAQAAAAIDALFPPLPGHIDQRECRVFS